MDETQRAIEEGIRRGIERRPRARAHRLADGCRRRRSLPGDPRPRRPGDAADAPHTRAGRRRRKQAEAAPTRSRLCVRRPPRTPRGVSSTRRPRGRTSSGSRNADKQTRALGTLARATRNAARAQLQPVVFAHAHSAPARRRRVRVRRWDAVPRRASGRVQCHGRARRDQRTARRDVLPATARPASPRGRPERSRGGGPLVAFERRVRSAIRGPEHPRPGEPRDLHTRRRAGSCGAPAKPPIVNIPRLTSGTGSAASSATSAAARATGCLDRT
jgi:hypothetical protein